MRYLNVQHALSAGCRYDRYMLQHRSTACGWRQKVNGPVMPDVWALEKFQSVACRSIDRVAGIQLVVHSQSLGSVLICRLEPQFRLVGGNHRSHHFRSGGCSLATRSTWPNSVWLFISFCRATGQEGEPCFATRGTFARFASREANGSCDKQRIGLRNRKSVVSVWPLGRQQRQPLANAGAARNLAFARRFSLHKKSPFANWLMMTRRSHVSPEPLA